MKFIEVISLTKIESFNDGIMSSRWEKETELINIDNIALVSNCGNIYLKCGYPNGVNVCKTDHSYEEIKQKIDNTLLDHFAGLAMQSLVFAHPNKPAMIISKTAYEIAKAMLKARKEANNA